MTTEVQSGTQPTTEAPAPALDAFGFGPEEVTPAEQPSPAPASNGNGAAPAADANGAAAPLAGEQPEDGEVLIDDKGQVRDAKSGRFVPHAKFHQAREKAKALETELGEYKTKFARADERLAVLNEALKGAPSVDGKTVNGKSSDNPFDEPDIDANVDIFKAFDQERRRNAWNKKSQEVDSGEVRATVANREIQNYYRQSQAKLPDYKEAHAHLSAFMHKELEAVYGVTDKAKRQQIIDDQERETVLDAVRSKIDPAQRIYQLATVRGYAKKAEKPAGEQKIEQIKNGQAAAGTLANAAGGASAPLTMEALNALSDDEYYERARALGKGNATLGLKLLRQAVGG